MCKRRERGTWLYYSFGGPDWLWLLTIIGIIAYSIWAQEAGV